MLGKSWHHAVQAVRDFPYSLHTAHEKDSNNVQFCTACTVRERIRETVVHPMTQFRR